MSDYVYREIMFGKPDGEEIFSDLSAESQGVHPRILYSVDDINYIFLIIQCYFYSHFVF